MQNLIIDRYFYYTTYILLLNLLFIFVVGVSIHALSIPTSEKILQLSYALRFLLFYSMLHSVSCHTLIFSGLDIAIVPLYFG